MKKLALWLLVAIVTASFSGVSFAGEAKKEEKAAAAPAAPASPATPAAPAAPEKKMEEKKS